MYILRLCHPVTVYLMIESHLLWVIFSGFHENGTRPVYTRLPCDQCTASRDQAVSAEYNYRGVITLQRWHYITEVLLHYRGVIILQRCYYITEVLLHYRGVITLQRCYYITEVLLQYRGVITLQRCYYITEVSVTFNDYACHRLPLIMKLHHHKTSVLAALTLLTAGPLLLFCTNTYYGGGLAALLH